MNEEKNSDKIFRDKLENFSVEPPAHVWSGIQEQLAQKKKLRRVVIIRWISAAAAILLAFLGGWYFSHNSEITETVTADKNIIQQHKDLPRENVVPETNNNVTVVPNQMGVASSVNAERQEKEKQKVASVKPDESVLIASSQKQKRELQSWHLIEGREPNFITKQKTEIQPPKTKQVFVNELTETDLALIAGNTADIRVKNQNPVSRWKLGAMVSPGYVSQVATHSQSYANNMTYSSSSGNANVTGGISVQMRTGKRWSIESGIYYDQNGQKSQHSLRLFEDYLNGVGELVDGVFAAPASDYAVSYTNRVEVTNGSMKMNSIAGVIKMDKTPVGTEVSGSIESNALDAPQALISSGDFSQVFDFVEIPLYLRYKLIDSRIGVEMLGGLNAALLVANNAYLDNEYGLQNIGKTQDISPLNFSGTVGLGLSYQLGKHFSLSGEPRFNYFFSSINTNPNVDFRPYRFGLYTGVYYEF